MRKIYVLTYVHLVTCYHGFTTHFFRRLYEICSYSFYDFINGFKEQFFFGGVMKFS